METTSLPQSLMLRIRFKGKSLALQPRVVASPDLPGPSVLAPRQRQMLTIAGSHARIHFIGTEGRGHDSSMALARSRCALQGLPGGVFFGPARSGFHRSTDWLRQKTGR